MVADRVLRATSILCTVLLLRGEARSISINDNQTKPPSAQQAETTVAPIAPERLDSLVAPIALYPDPLLAQVLAASTYPLEIVQLQKWLEKHKDLKDKKLEEAVKKEKWDPSVQAMAALPDVVKQLADNIKWTDELGNAFLAQQSDVMAAVQRMRAKAQDSGNLKSTEQMKVETKVVESKQVIVIEQAKPQVVYVPSYNPTVVWGAPVYPYPPVAYPPPGYYAAGAAISFGVGVAMGAMWSGGWGWNCGWGGHNTVNINTNNNFNRNTNVNRNANVNRTSNRWEHNAQHRGGAPYANRATADRFGGTARGETVANRQANARQNAGQRQGTAGNRNGGASNSLGANRTAGNRSGGGDRIGNRQVSNGSANRGAGAFAGGSRSTASANLSRGASSFGGSRGGGGFGGGGRRR